MSNSRMGANHYKTPPFLACSASFLPVPALHIHRKRLLSLLHRQNNQPEGHLMSWTSAWAMRGFRAKEPSAWQDAASCPRQNPAVSRGKKQTKPSDTGSRGKREEKELAYFFLSTHRTNKRMHSIQRLFCAHLKSFLTKT